VRSSETSFWEEAYSRGKKEKKEKKKRKEGAGRFYESRSRRRKPRERIGPIEVIRYSAFDIQLYVT